MSTMIVNEFLLQWGCMDDLSGNEHLILRLD